MEHVKGGKGKFKQEKMGRMGEKGKDLGKIFRGRKRKRMKGGKWKQGIKGKRGRTTNQRKQENYEKGKTISRGEKTKGENHLH